MLGKHEFALRLFPLLAGLISLWLFYRLLTRVTYGIGLLIPLALFAFNPRLVYYSSEVKQYIVDVTVTILLLLLAAPAFSASPRKQDFAWLTLAGLLALWFSHPALFVLAGIGLALVVIILQRRDYSSFPLVIGMGIVWLISIVFLYVLILKDLSQNAYMREYWLGAFAPMPLWSDWTWFATSIPTNIRLQFGMPYAPLLVFLIMLIGWIVLWFHQQEYALIFVFLGLVTLIASALQFYPLMERMILFLVPVGLILIGKALEAIHLRLQDNSFAGVLAISLLAGYLLFGSFVASIQNFIAPKYFEHIRPTMGHLRDTWKDGDALFVSNGALPAFRFYAPFYGLEAIPYEYGRREDYKAIENIASQLMTLDGEPRAWILFSHVNEREGFNEREFVLEILNQMGEEKREFRVPGTSVFLYLFDLRN
jgi:hypothetical protein